jgi:threonine/homoserine/homoserine lactone efflux protein
VIAILILCLVILVAITQTVATIFLTPHEISSDLLFAVLYLAGLVYLTGIVWSAVRLLTDRQPSLQADGEGLTLRHLPFLGNLSIAWSEVKSVHVVRTLFLTHLCVVPIDARQWLKRRNLLLFALNASTRLGMRANAPLSISQNALDRPARDLVERFVKDYGVKETA